jgi:hypothetical protein
MSEQIPLFDATIARALRDEGIWAADHHAVPQWKDAALLALKRCAEQNDRFIVDRVWRYLPSGFDTHELRAMGAVMRAGVKRGWIQRTPDFIASARTTSHKNPRRVWRSCIWQRSAA